MQIPFIHHDRAGIINVTVDVIADGVAAGFDILPSLPFAPDAAVGYPSMHAAVEYNGTGYRMLLGWIQLVHSIRQFPGGVIQNVTDVDIAPAFYGTGLPFFALGYPANIFDAPSNNLNGADHLEWVADTFLVTVPTRGRHDHIQPLASFRWGYQESSDPGSRPAISPLASVGLATWPTHREILKAEYATWTYA